MNNPYVTDEVARAAEVIGWGLQTENGVTTVFPYLASDEVTGGDNFWPQRELAQAEADRCNKVPPIQEGEK